MKVFGFVVHADGRAPMFFSFKPDMPQSAQTAYEKAREKAQQLRHRGYDVSPVSCTHRPRGPGWSFVPTVSDIVHDCLDVDLSDAETMDDECPREDRSECKTPTSAKAKSAKKSDPRWRVRKKTTTRDQQLTFETFFDSELQARLHFEVLTKSLRSGESLMLVSPTGRVMRKASAKELDS